jgi:hypothetical protein
MTGLDHGRGWPRFEPNNMGIWPKPSRAIVAGIRKNGLKF